MVSSISKDLGWCQDADEDYEDNGDEDYEDDDEDDKGDNNTNDTSNTGANSNDQTNNNRANTTSNTEANSNNSNNNNNNNNNNNRASSNNGADSNNRASNNEANNGASTSTNGQDFPPLPIRNVITPSKSELETIVSSVALIIRMIYDTVKLANAEGGELAEADCQSVAQACVDIFSSHNKPTPWNKLSTVTRALNPLARAGQNSGWSQTGNIQVTNKNHKYQCEWV